MVTSAGFSRTAPGAVPLLGHLPLLAWSPLGFLKGLSAYGPLVQIRIGRRPAYVVTRPDLVRRLHGDHYLFDKGGPFYETSRRFFGNGVVNCPAAEHAQQRPLMQPAFHRSRIQTYAEVMRDVAEEVVDSWRPGRVIRLDQETHRMTAMVASRTLISAPQGGPAAAQIAASHADIMQGLYWRMVIPGRLFPRLPLPVNRRYDRQVARTRRTVDDVVDHYRTTGTDHGDVLSMVIAACEQEDDPQQAVFDQVVQILSAAVETTAAALVWTLRLLDRHPLVAQRVLTEIEEVLEGRPPDHRSLTELPYTQRVLTEAIRLYPPGWLVSRATTAEVAWDEGRIPAGADVFFSHYTLHRDAGLFPDPDAFDPDRWSPERVTTAQRQGFLGFGTGRRKCLGDVFGTTEATIALVTVLSRWRLRFQQCAERPVPRLLLLPPATPVMVEPRPGSGS
ncbi:cytochrome P450 [Streptomyces sp. NPDC048278]|uniref:cytochrome P450 n=1 Tax=Streptomyces sp. NPDC048278 TaxID=3155809 RepID=UPI003424C61E